MRIDQFLPVLSFFFFFFFANKNIFFDYLFFTFFLVLSFTLVKELGFFSTVSEIIEVRDSDKGGKRLISLILSSFWAFMGLYVELSREGNWVAARVDGSTEVHAD
jgi:hypothetical protein